jgi:hypothetical protein
MPDVLTPDAVETMQEPAGITTCADAAIESTPPLCSCGATERHATVADRCARGHALPGNQLHRTHGTYSFRDRGEAALPSDVRMTVAEFKAQVVSDRGVELSAIEAARIGHLAEVETTLRLLAHDLATRGLMTAKGRVRSTFSKWLEALDRWERLAGHIGDGRRARQVPSLSDYLAQQAQAPSPEDHA